MRSCPTCGEDTPFAHVCGSERSALTTRYELETFLERANQRAERAEALLAEAVFDRERLLWVLCRASCAAYCTDGQRSHEIATRILREHGYDEERIERMAAMPEPEVPK